MFIDYKDQELAFRFRHNTNPSIDIPRGTECTVTDREGNFVAKSFARLHPKDNFDKAKGREIAFGRALQEFVPKEDRFQFWEKYSNWRTKFPRIVLGTKKPTKAKLTIVYGN